MSRPVIEVQSDSITIDKLTKDIRRQGFSQTIQTYNFDVSNPTRPITPERVYFVHPSFDGFTSPYFKTIQSALESVTDSDGFSIIIYGAEYAENLTVSEDNVTIITSGNVVVTPDLSSGGTHGLLVDANNFRLFGNLIMTALSDGFDGIRITNNANYCYLEFHNIAITDGNAISNTSSLLLDVVCHNLSSVNLTGCNFTCNASYAISNISLFSSSICNITTSYITFISMYNCGSKDNVITAKTAINPLAIIGDFLNSVCSIFDLTYFTSATDSAFIIDSSNINLVNCNIETGGTNAIRLLDTNAPASVTLRNTYVKGSTYSLQGFGTGNTVNYLNQSTIKPDTDNVVELLTVNKVIQP